MLEKTVTLYLLDRDENGNGDAKGRIEYTVGNWEGVAYKIPRAQKERCDKQCDDSKTTLGKRLKQPGLYCLLGKTNEGRTTIHVGKADSSEGMWTRVNGKHRENANIDKNWTEAVIFVHSSSEKSFLDGPGLNHIEKKFCQLLKEEEKTGRYNYEVFGNESSAGSDGTEEQQGVLNKFAENAKRLMMIILLYLKNLPTDEADEDNKKGEILLFMKAPEAKGTYVSDKKFILHAGSKICPTKADSCRNDIKKMRKKHAHKIDKNGVLTEDITFGSPSGAAKFVYGVNRDGRTDWHDANEKTLKELLDEED